MESKTSRRFVSLDTNFERAEFISARTDTKQKLGELFIFHPTKLEMFGLRQVSSKIPKFDHPKPMFELQPSETSRSLTHGTSTILADCQKCNQSLSRMVTNKPHQELLVLSSPQLIAEEKKQIKIPPPKNLENHQPRTRNDLPPILAHPQIQTPPFDIHSAKTEKKQKKIGKLNLGRLAKPFDHELLQTLTTELQWMKTDGPIQSPNTILLKYVISLLNQQILKRSKQPSLSKAIKEEKKTHQIQERKNEFEMFKQKEREINTIIFNNSKVGHSVDDFL